MQGDLDSQPVSEDSEILSVAELIEKAQDALSQSPGSFWFEGEVSDFKGPAASGHLYFKIKGRGAVVSVKMWRRVAGRGLKCELKEGLQVRAQGLLDVYPKTGQLSVTLSEVTSAGGEGELFRRYVELGKRLRAEGVFDAENKQDLPSRPSHVVVLTGKGSAAEADMRESFARHRTPIEVKWLYTRVQGTGASSEISDAIRQAIELKPDVILLSRGGGSLEDLWAFNEEELIYAVRDCPLPILCAIGHENDHTLAEHASDHRAKTPTAAADVLCQGWLEVATHIEHLGQRLSHASANQLQGFKTSLAGLFRDLRNQAPERRLERARALLAETETALCQASSQLLHHLRFESLQLRHRLLQSGPDSDLAAFHARLDGLQHRLDAANPLGLLKRGYALVTTAHGKFLRSPQDVQSGDLIHVRLSEGELDATVK